MPMLLGALFRDLFARGVTLVATSNSPPDDLYKEGLQRARFLPAIKQIKEHTRVVHMDAGADYRGMNRDLGNRSREREGLWANSFSDGAWTADAADRTERDWHLGGGRGGYDRDIRPAGWRGGMQGGMSGGGMGMNRGGTPREHGWNLGQGDGFLGLVHDARCLKQRRAGLVCCTIQSQEHAFGHERDRHP